MDEAWRRRCLRAMGIQLWIPRSGGGAASLPPASDEAPWVASAALDGARAAPGVPSQDPPQDQPDGRPEGDLQALREGWVPPHPGRNDAPPEAALPGAVSPGEATPPSMSPAPGQGAAKATPDGRDAPDQRTASAGADAAAPDAVAQLDWADLQTRVAACTLCPELARSRNHTVFGAGDPGAQWMFIGEAPGAEEDRRGEPFVGRAGQLLDRMLAALGMDRGQGVYIANILKCRPPTNRDPRPEEAHACRPYLDRQIALVRPRVLVALGRVAAQNLLDTAEPLGRLRGRILDYRGTPLVVTYHPAYLLRKPQDKRKAWDDLCLARRAVQGEGAEPGERS